MLHTVERSQQNVEMGDNRVSSLVNVTDNQRGGVIETFILNDTDYNIVN